MNADINEKVNSEIHVELTNINEFDNIIKNLNNSLNRISTLFHEEKVGINNVFNNQRCWNGRAQVKANEKYTEITSMYPSITESLGNFISFLEKASDKYKRFEAKVNQNVEDNLDSLNVNS